MFLVALGVSLTLGVMRLVNIGNGAFYMLGAYISALVSPQLDISEWQMVPAILGGVVTGVIGAAVEAAFIQRSGTRSRICFPFLGPTPFC